MTFLKKSNQLSFFLLSTFPVCYSSFPNLCVLGEGGAPFQTEW